jgi:hypothetical protein
MGGPSGNPYIITTVYKNGVSYKGGTQQTFQTGGSWPASSFSSSMYLNANDYLEVFKGAGGGVQQNGQPGASFTWADFAYLGAG